MIIYTMSASRIKKYLQCAESYHQTYENKVRGGALHLTFGTLMHSVFERYYQEDIDIQKLYEEEWNKADIMDPEFFRDGFDIINNFLEMNNKDEHVPMGFELPFAINIATGKIYDTDSVNWDDSNEVRGFLDSLEDEDSPIIFGFIDRLEYDAENDILRVVDYKTSRMAMTQSEADEDIQMSMYDLVSHILFPDFKTVTQELQYVRLGVAVRTSRTQAQRDTFTKWLISIFYKIREDNTHIATLNKFCGWCDAKHLCESYNKLINGEAEEDFTLDGLTNDELDEQLEKINIHLKILDGRKKEIETHFKTTLKKSDNSPIQTRNGERFLTPNLRTHYNIDTVMELFPDHYHNLLSVNKGEVDKLVGKDTDLKNMLEASASKQIQSHTLRKRKS